MRTKTEAQVQMNEGWGSMDEASAGARCCVDKGRVRQGQDMRHEMARHGEGSVTDGRVDDVQTKVDGRLWVTDSNVDSGHGWSHR